MNWKESWVLHTLTESISIQNVNLCFILFLNVFNFKFQICVSADFEVFSSNLLWRWISNSNDFFCTSTIHVTIPIIIKLRQTIQKNHYNSLKGNVNRKGISQRKACFLFFFKFILLLLQKVGELKDLKANVNLTTSHLFFLYTFTSTWR